jgi:hypothetical protein
MTYYWILTVQFFDGERTLRTESGTIEIGAGACRKAAFEHLYGTIVREAALPGPQPVVLFFSLEPDALAH